jgi:hypothetical protein
MAQTIDMKRLHMGCGESLRGHLPLAFLIKRRPMSSPQANTGCNESETVSKGKTGRKESR